MSEILNKRQGYNSVGIPITITVYSDKYTVEIADILEEYNMCGEVNIDDIYIDALRCADIKYGKRIDMSESKDEEQQEIMETMLAEVLLGQAEILANQSVQDEVLAEVLLNSLEV